MVLTIGYDVENFTDPEISKEYSGEITTDRYGRKVPKHACGTINIDHKTASTKIITNAVMELYEKIINKKLLIRRINLTAQDVINEDEEKIYKQIDLFDNYDEIKKQRDKEKSEKNLQKAVINIKSKYGKNAILKGMNFVEGGTTIERNSQIGGHKS